MNDTVASPVKKRRKYSTVNLEDRADIGRYAAENGNAATVRQYGVGKSMVRLFQKKYFAELRACVKKNRTANWSMQ